MQGSDWNTFSQHIDKLASAQINNLKTLTRDHLNTANNEKKARYIKVAYVDSYDGPIFYDTQGAKIVPPRVVLWEVHPEVQGLSVNWNDQPTTVDALKKALRTQYLPPDLQTLKIEIYFASMLLRDQKVHSEPETLRHYLLSYCDKIYAKPLPQQFNTTWIQYKTYFNQVQEMVLTSPALYSELCRKLKELFLPQSPQIMSISEDKLYSYLIMLRNLPETVARANTGHIEAAISIRLLPQ